MGGGGSKERVQKIDIDKLSEDSQIDVLSFFDENDVFYTFCFVSKNFNQLCNNNRVWEIFTKRRFKGQYKKLRKRFRLGEDEDVTDWRTVYLVLNSFRKSKILKKGTERYLLNKLYGKELQQWRLVYRGTDNTFDGEGFHSRCDEHRGTITLIQTKETDCVFGGFSPCKWHSYSSYSWHEDTFIYSLKRNGKYEPMRFNNDGKFKRSIYGNPQKLAVFGWGPDIHISVNCRKERNSFTNLGESFGIPKVLGFSVGSEEAKSFLAGEENFLVEEMEVFQRCEESKIIKQQGMPM